MFLQAFTFLIVLYFFFRNKIDFLLLFLGSTILYNWQIIYGTIWVPPYSFSASEESKIIVLIILAILIIFTFINDLLLQDKEEKSYKIEKEKDDFNFFIVLTIFSYLATLYAIINAGQFLLSEKREFLSASGLPYFFITYYPAAMAFLFFMISKRYKYALVAFIPLLFYLLVGYRAAIVITIVFSFFVFYYNSKIFTIQIYKPIIFVISTFVFFVAYKFSYIGLKAGDLYTIANIIEQDPRFGSYIEFFIYAFFSAEFGQAASNLSITSSMDLSKEYSFITTLLGSLPFIDTLFGVSEEGSRFSTVIEAHANPGFSYGLGGTIWGEIYQAGGFSGVLIFSILVIFLIFQYNLSFLRSKEKFSLFAYFVGFLAFYIHRNDFVLFVAHIKNILFLSLLVFAILWIFKNKISMNPFKTR
ncbi:MAG: hypothetical protein CMG62_10885 [Candidatus Marinimicrobia bacterium]|nr:hypothetical protein [Candidatus Neomarinimicrobiota bacterium]|tara:strand:- start:261 stop:1508 length:1248 start_codon:yes stop_codon:yes gene_type:complete